MEKILKTVALIQESRSDRKKFLLRQNGTDATWRFVVADRLGGEGFRESAAREVARELRLDSRSSFLVSSMAQLSVEFRETIGDSAEQRVEMAFVNVHIYRETVLRELEEDAFNRWFSAAEICRGRAPSGALIHPRFVNWINRWNVIQPWQ